MVYWHDFEQTSPTPLDVEGHGTCVSSIALGSGAAFEASAPALKWTKSWVTAGVPTGLVVSRQLEG